MAILGKNLSWISGGEPTLKDKIRRFFEPVTEFFTGLKQREMPQTIIDPTTKQKITIPSAVPTVEMRPPFQAEIKQLPIAKEKLGALKIVPEIVSRLLEIIPKWAVQTIQNFREIQAGGVADPLKLPFDAKRLGFDTPEVESTGRRLWDKYNELNEIDPPTNELGIWKNAALSSLMVVVPDAMDAFIAGNMIELSAKSILKATKYDPQLERSLSELGLPQNRQFTARELIERTKESALNSKTVGDYANTQKAWNYILEKNFENKIPIVSNFVKKIQSVAKDLILPIEQMGKGFQVSPIAERTALGGFADARGGLSISPKIGGDELAKQITNLAKQNITPEVIAKTLGTTEPIVNTVLGRLAKGVLEPTPLAQKGVKEAVEPEIREVIPTEPQIPTVAKKPQDSIKIVMDALAKAKKITPIQEYIYTKERGEKLARAVSVGVKIEGEKGFIAQLGQLKGDMKVQFESLRTQIGQEDVDNLFNLITKDTTLSEWNKINAKQGLAKLLGEYGAGIPTPGEIKLLKDVFGDDFTNTILDKRNLLQKLANAGYELANVPRAIMASFDLSAPLRQGIFFIGRPKQFLPAFTNMFKQFGSQKAFNATQEAITKLPSYKLMQESGLQLTEMGGELTQREEAYMSSWAEKIPLVGIGIKASNRAYTGFLNKLRADVFDNLITHSSQVGLNPDKNPKLIREIANLVNAGTGRGALGIFEKSATWLNTVFFSPRLMASRLTLLNPIYYTKADPFVRKEALKSLLSFLGIGLTILGLAKANGAKVESDPRSADFAKIKIKDTRLDVWGGFQQIFRTVAQVASGKIISTTTGREMILGEGYRPLTRADIIQRFFEYKTSPVFSFALAMLEGKTAIGEEFKVSKEVGLRLVPMVMQDMYDAVKEYDWIQGLGLSLPAIFGVGVQTYKPKPINELRMKIRDGEATMEDIQQAVKDGLIKDDKQKIIDFIKDAKLSNDLYSFKNKSTKAQVDFLEGMAKEDILKYLPYKNRDFLEVLKTTTEEQQQAEANQPKIPEGKTSETNIISQVVLYAKAIGTDPVTAFNRIFTGQKIRRIDSKTIIVERMPFGGSQAVREERGVVGDMILDHTLPLQLGGSNNEDNLQLVSYDEWKSYTPVENKLGKLLRDGEITKQKAQQLIKDFKNGKITANEILNL